MIIYTDGESVYLSYQSSLISVDSGEEFEFSLPEGFKAVDVDLSGELFTASIQPSFLGPKRQVEFKDTSYGTFHTPVNVTVSSDLFLDKKRTKDLDQELDRLQTECINKMQEQLLSQVEDELKQLEVIADNVKNIIDKARFGNKGIVKTILLNTSTKINKVASGLLEIK